MAEMEFETRSADSGAEPKRYYNMLIRVTCWGAWGTRVFSGHMQPHKRSLCMAECLAESPSLGRQTKMLVCLSMLAHMGALAHSWTCILSAGRITIQMLFYFNRWNTWQQFPTSLSASDSHPAKDDLGPSWFPENRNPHLFSLPDTVPAAEL